MSTVSSYYDLPEWVWALVGAALEYEDQHAGGGLCLGKEMDAVPKDVQLAAKVLRSERERQCSMSENVKLPGVLGCSEKGKDSDKLR
jgi:hypothetical protein